MDSPPPTPKPPAIPTLEHYIPDLPKDRPSESNIIQIMKSIVKNSGACDTSIFEKIQESSDEKQKLAMLIEAIDNLSLVDKFKLPGNWEVKKGTYICEHFI